MRRGKTFLSFSLIIKHAVAIALKVGVCDLLTKLLADALIFFLFRKAAGTVAVLCLQTFTDGFYDFLVGIFSDFH